MIFENRDFYSRNQEIEDFYNFLTNKVEINSRNKERYAKEIALLKIIEIYESNEKQDVKVEKLAKLVKDAESFRKDYKKLGRYEDDPVLGPYYKKVQEVAKYIEKISDKIATAKFRSAHKDYYENAKKAEDVIIAYRKSDKMYLSDFLKEASLLEEDLKYYAKVGEFFNPCLAILYREKQSQSYRDRRYNARKSFEAMYKGITTGYTKDGKEFDELDCLSLLPFKNNKNLAELLEDFGAKGDSTIYKKVRNLLFKIFSDEKDQVKAETINDYIFERKLLPANEKLISEREIREDREIINGRELSDDDKEAIVRYLNITETPFYPKAYTLTRNKVLEGKLYIDKEEKVLKMKI